MPMVPPTIPNSMPVVPSKYGALSHDFASQLMIMIHHGLTTYASLLWTAACITGMPSAVVRTRLACTN